MSRKMTLTAVSVLTFSLIAFSILESASQAFARGGRGAGRGHVGRSVGRPRAARGFARKSGRPIRPSWGWGGGNYYFGSGGGCYGVDGSCGLGAVPVVQTADAAIADDAGSDIGDDVTGAAPVVASGDPGDGGDGGAAGPGDFGRDHHRPHHTRPGHGRQGHVRHGGRGGSRGQMAHINHGGRRK
jgi:hypothetical protein